MTALAPVIGEDRVPILVLTAQTDEDTHRRALKGGARDFVHKPFRQWEVLQRIHNLLEAQFLAKSRRRRAQELAERVREQTEELRQTQLSILQSLGRAGEFRDNETGAHVIRMSRSCQLLAQAAGMDQNAAELVLNASPMHDVGKIGIPDYVLLKPGRLTDQERAIMETHVTIGAQIIGVHNSPILVVARQIARGHHERWDGAGYPLGLQGVSIPIESRIAAICDVFDALTSKRPYKSAWSVDRAIHTINNGSGSFFDPRLVSLFNDILPEVVALREVFPDIENGRDADTDTDDLENR